MSLWDKIFGKTPEEPNIEEKEETILNWIEEGALNLLLDALQAEKEKIISDAFLVAQQDNREKISYEDMVISLQKNGFSVELLNTD